MKDDPVFIIAIMPGHPMFCGAVLRFVSKIMVDMYGSDKIKVSEIDPSIKSEYKKFLSSVF